MHTRHLAPSALLALGLLACDASDDTGAAACGEHGDWEADHGHCHCDDGYQLTDDGMGCEPDEDDGDDTSVDTSGFSPDTVEGAVQSGSDPVWLLSAKDGQTWLSIENYPSFGGATGPETRTLDATEIDYATCGVCLMLQTGCETHGDHGHCEATFMPEVGGEVTFDVLGAAAGEQWAGAVSGIRFVEVEIDSETYATTPVPGGATFSLDAWDFDVVLEEL